MKVKRLKTKLGAFLAILFVLMGARTLAAKDPQTIVFLTWKPNQPEVWDGLIERFHQEHPDIRVKVQVGPHSSTEYHAVVTQRLKNKDASVDVFFMDVIWPPEFASAGWALDLTSRFSKEAQAAFLAPTIRANTYQGHIYGVPCYLGAGLFYYRTDLLSKYKLEPPRTWSEMLVQGQAIVAGENDPTLHIYSAQFKQYEGLVCNMLEFIWSHGGDVVAPARRSVLLNRTDAIEAVTFVRDRIVGEAAPKGAINYEEPESLGLFIQGRAIFHRNWPYAWAVANDPQKSRVARDVAVGALPAFKGHNPASTLGGWQFGISRWSRRPDEAWAFVRFMTSFSSQKRLALDGGLAPTRIAVYDDPQVKQEMPHLRSFLPAFKTARPRPKSPLYPMISAELQRFFSQAIAGDQTDLRSLADGASARIERILKMEAAIQQ
jgi:multiple sugar transport system substrate-binding protein